jgi:hypothetical protein
MLLPGLDPPRVQCIDSFRADVEEGHQWECVYYGFDTQLREAGCEPVCMGCAARLDTGEKLPRKEKPQSEKSLPDEKTSSAGS